MRKDMHKLLCERPRAGHADRDRDREVPARSYSRNLELVHGEDDDGEYVESNSPHRMKMGRGWTGHGTKELNENLNPLWRWLDKQVGRPWNNVYSELRENIDARSPIKLHILEHLEHHVVLNVEIDGKSVFLVIRGQFRQAELWRDDLYVHPRTKILCRYEGGRLRSWRGDNSPKDTIRVDDKTYLCQVKGIWYRLDFDELPDLSSFQGSSVHPDRYLKYFRWVDIHVGRLPVPFKKKQLSSKELRNHNLENERAA